MMFYYVLLCSMMFSDVLWCSMMFYDVLWCSMVFYDVLWCSIMLYDVLWCYMMFYDVLWCSMMFFDVLWCSMMFYVLRAFLISFCRKVHPEFLRSFFLAIMISFSSSCFQWSWINCKLVGITILVFKSPSLYLQGSGNNSFGVHRCETNGNKPKIKSWI